MEKHGDYDQFEPLLYINLDKFIEFNQMKHEPSGLLHNGGRKPGRHLHPWNCPLFSKQIPSFKQGPGWHAENIQIIKR